MAEEFEVRGHHERVLDEAAEAGEPLAQRIALFSAVLATIGAVVSLAGGHTESDALYSKNEAVLLKAQASDVWAYYQAEGIKRHLDERSPDAASPERRASIARYAAKARALQAQAEALDRRSEEANVESSHAFRPHIKLAIAMTFVQIGIALASITALTRRRWLFGLAAGAAATGCLLAAIAWF
ncbi:MAG: DUF4337 domain-containing protein [Janthinobacterium lividum]